MINPYPYNLRPTFYLYYFKPLLDRFFALVGLLLFFLPIIFLETKSFGLYSQYRVGQHGKLFLLYKLKTMYDTTSRSTVTTSRDTRITPTGLILRRFKLDELPQLYNILIGDMSFVGPRPDVPGYLDTLPPKYLPLLSIRPGITCLSSLFFRAEESLLSTQADPQLFNDSVLWPMKVRLNMLYLSHVDFQLDFLLLIMTLLPFKLSRLIFILIKPRRGSSLFFLSRFLYI